MARDFEHKIGDKEITVSYIVHASDPDTGISQHAEITDVIDSDGKAVETTDQQMNELTEAANKLIDEDTSEFDWYDWNNYR